MNNVEVAADVAVFPASFAQQRLWFLDQVERESPLHNMPSAFRLGGWLDVAELTRALDEVVARHDALRTVLTMHHGEVFQTVLPTVELHVPVVELCGIARPEARESQVRRLIADEARTPFRLSEGPLLRGKILRLAEDDHVLLLTVHLAISDVVSQAALLTELSALYTAFVETRTSPLESVPIHYAEYAVWQREWFQGDRLQRALAYWRERLAGPLPVLALPTDRPRPAIQTTRGESRGLALDRRTVEGLETLARESGVSLFVVMLASFKTLLHRYTGQDDILLGSPAADRDGAGIDGAIGPYANTVVYRTQVGGDPTFRELLERVGATVTGAVANGDVPFEKVVEAVHPARDPSYGPMFQAMFTMRRALVNALRLPGITAGALPVGTSTARCDLMLEIVQDVPGVDGGMQAVLEFNTDLFDVATADRMLGHFRTLVESAAANPDARLSEMPLLGAAERREVLVDWNATRRVFGGAETVSAMFESVADERPDDVAVEMDGTVLTYAELDRRANQLANYLRSLGVGPEVLVGICVDRTPDMVVALLGTLKAGGAYLPLDPALPGERLRFMLDDAEVSVVLTRDALRDELPEHSARVVCLDTDWESAVGPSSDNRPAVAVSGETQAYTIYTSGSTGRPKGVQVVHSAIVNLLHSMRETPGARAGDRLVAVSTLSFDIAGVDVYLPLVTGGRVVIADRETASDGAALSALLRRAGATMLQATPATFRLLLDAGWEGMPELRVFVTGEAAPRQLVDDLIPRAAEVWNLYGPTETTVYSTMQRLAPGDGPVLIGRPIANTEVYVLDRHCRPVPAGVPGELYIGGAGLARGYLKRPELTAERFVPHPFARVGGARADARLYRTGDLVRFTRDPGAPGALEYLGRVDFQVKVRGFRIELGEIESVLLRHEAVKQAVVTVQEDRLGERRLVGYVVFHPAASATQSELRRALRATLPDYMVPSLIQELDAMPLTQSGKVDRKALPDPFALEGADDGFAEPSTPMEQLIAGIWREVLGITRVGIHDNFFELGGHSLLSMRVISRIEQKVGCRIHPRAMVLQTLEQIASEAEQFGAR